MVFIRTYFSLLSSVSLTLSPSLAPDKRERPFVLLQTIRSLDYSRVLGLCKKYGLFCGLKDFALIVVSVPGMENLAVILIELKMTG